MRDWIKEHKLWTAGGMLFGLLVLMALLVPVCSEYSFSGQNAALTNAAFSSRHWFGTDKFGRDIFVRIWYGTRISLFIGLSSALIGGGLGMLLGGLAGAAGGWIDMVLMRVADVIAAIPSLLYVILITLVLGGNAGSILLGISISAWIHTARIVRGEIVRVKEQEFIQAARLSGVSGYRIFFRYLLPQSGGVAVVSLIFLIPQAIFTEVFLSFAGIGIAAPAASLGTLISDARSQIQLYPSQILLPIAVLCLLMIAVHLIGADLEKLVSRKG